MTRRLDYPEANPPPMRGMFLLEEASLVRMRASQLNGCRETSFFAPRECAALARTEAVTLLSQNEVSDEIYETVGEQCSESEIVALAIASTAINGWNRLAIPFRTPQDPIRVNAGQPARV